MATILTSGGGQNLNIEQPVAPVVNPAASATANGANAQAGGSLAVKSDDPGHGNLIIGSMTLILVYLWWRGRL